MLIIIKKTECNQRELRLEFGVRIRIMFVILLQMFAFALLPAVSIERACPD